MRCVLPNKLALLVFVSALLPAAPAFAGFGAIAWDRETGKAGWTFNQPAPKNAVEKALSECGTAGCKVIIRTKAKQCSAIATTANGKAIGASARSSVEAARTRAMEDCAKRKAGECTVRASDCDK